MRYCPDCGSRLTTKTAKGGGIPRRVCPQCVTADETRGWSA
ncbi:hypothetical protein BRC96_09020 [Halobacteriales archaeon QS_6_64_34]|nr:MAG: hypothetical protein BRC96_09020 [Halobacteriales archaeon QS_6_64_34]